MKTIICPNCGAENSQSKKCEYCGTMLKCVNTTDSASRTKKTSAEEFAEKVAKYKEVYGFNGGVSVVVSTSELEGVINENGDLIIPLSTYHINNYGGRLLVDESSKGCKIYDASGNILVEANRITYIGNGDFLLEHKKGGKQLIYDINNQIIPISLPDNVRIYNNSRFFRDFSSLGDGYYVIEDDDGKQGIGTCCNVVLQCKYIIDHNEYWKLHNDFPNLITVGDNSHGTGIYDLKAHKFILSPHYSIYFGDEKYYNGKLCVIESLFSRKCGIFDLIKQTIIVETKYKRITLEKNGKCKAVKGSLFGDNEITIQL